MTLVLSEIHCYPVKSCRGLSLERAALDAWGLAHDRRWMVVDPHGHFLTQRQEPRLALVVPRLSETHLTLNAPGRAPLALPLEAAPGPVRPVTVWQDRVRAQDEGDPAAAWFSAFLERPVRLVRTGPAFRRRVPAGFGEEADQVGFADGFPFLLIGQASLDDLNARLEQPLAMARFRPNLVVAGGRPYEEDGWRQIRIGEVAFKVVKPCARCAITTVDPHTGRRGREPLATLATYRRTPDGKVLFGQNLVHARKEGTVRVGDRVEVLA